MKCLVIAALVACALAKPVEKTQQKRQLDQFPYAAQSFQSINQFDGRALPTSQLGFETQSTTSPSVFFGQSSGQGFGLNDVSSLSNGASFDQTLSQRFGSLNNVQPEITNVGNSGLNSRTVSTTAAPPSSFSIDYSNFPTSTVSPLFNSEVSSISPIGSSEFSSQSFSSTPLPDISSTFSSSTFDSLNQNPAAIPIVSSSGQPSDLLQSRFTSNNLFSDNSNFQGLDLNSFDLNKYIEAGSRVQSESNFVVNSDKAPEVTKSLYFYEAPEELEPIRQRKIVQLPPQKTNYKILFIKAPSAPEPQPIEIPAQLQNNEKTRVYVLVKKPETEQEVRIVAAPTPKPERPEVFYIKYKTREEAEKAIKEAQEGAALGQASINVNGQQLVSKIKNAKVSHNDGSLLVKQTLPSSSVSLNSFESSTALPFISSTGAFGNLYDSSTVSSLLNNANLNQFSLYNSPVISSSPSPFSTSGNFYSNGNNLFASGNNPFSSGANQFYSGANQFTSGNNLFSSGNLRSNNFGSFGGLSVSPNSYISQRFSNNPSFIGFNQKPQLFSRVGRIDNAEEKKESTTASNSVTLLEKTFDNVADEKNSVDSTSSINKDEPLQLSLGGGEEKTTQSTVFTNAVESSSTTEASIVDESSTTSSESSVEERK